MNADEMATIDDVNRMRDIALKFLRGHTAEYRDGYKKAGFLGELEDLRYKLCETLVELKGG